MPGSVVAEKTASIRAPYINLQHVPDQHVAAESVPCGGRRSTARITSGQRVALYNVENVHMEERDGQEYWVYEHLAQVKLPAHAASRISALPLLQTGTNSWCYVKPAIAARPGVVSHVRGRGSGHY